MTSGTFRSKNFGDLPELHLIDVNVPFVLNELKVTPVPVPHDACEPVQYVFDFAGRRLGILTDLGSISAHVERAYQDCDALLLEANYDPMMLASGGYPYSLKQRVGGAWGHLSNQQSGGFLERLDVHRLQHLVIAHMSQQNNTLTAVESVFAPIVSSVSQLTYADQDQGFDWLSIV
jgi:phosphoribosyl 1,2-cyclic phosphodiesterase